MMEEYNTMKRINAIYTHNKDKFEMNEDPVPEVITGGNAYLYNLDSLDENGENSQKYSYYIMTYFSMNLEQYLGQTTGIAKIQDVFEVACQLLNTFKLVHRAKRTFNDLKPENIMITPPSKGDEKLKVHLIDFGCADKFIDETTKEHIKEGELKNDFKGNILYASINQMDFIRTSPRDDIESVFYLIMS